MIAGGIAALSLTIAALAGTIAFECTDWRPAPAELSARSAPRPGTDAPGHRASRRNDIDADLSEVAARPVFSPDRKPVGSVTTVTGLSRLTGIVVTDTRKIAVFAAPSGGLPIIAEEGSRISAYEVRAISASGVTVAGPAGITVITPIFDAAPPPASQRPSPVLPASQRPAN
jgi:hypothetical protein